MTEPGYQGASTPDPNAPEAQPTVPGQYVPPAGGTPQPAPVPPPPGYSSADDKTWALVAHFGAAIGAFVSFGVLGFVGPLVSYLNKAKLSETVNAHAKGA